MVSRFKRCTYYAKFLFLLLSLADDVGIKEVQGLQLQSTASRVNSFQKFALDPQRRNWVEVEKERKLVREKDFIRKYKKCRNRILFTTIEHFESVSERRRKL
jgi:hypothetical protein